MSHEEIDIAVALRLGEPMPSEPPDFDLAMMGGHLSNGKCWRAVSYYSEGDIPRWVPKNWAENDGLAFKELWPRITMPDLLPIYLLGFNWEGKCGVFINDYPDLISVTLEDTWALAICKAFLELVPLPKGVE